ncbi:GntR family transcriptional regulator [Halobacillus salinarum]|uniref:GntR family transcriptional regulator n=1 Tax=Halobacillus salinarum TaxID=2932257 RepID=A0ABY4EL18_9BACI|nr:GntR family transcriptional regulator [Halobacillus salinarum]UOQ45160.1 GntR family transcriptional regulator [Halobacillus salinarum]
MLIHLDLEASDPIYNQLKNQIIAGIAKGELVPGERLPSVRALAQDLGINLHTVNKAYQQLKQDGFILIHRQKGVVVQPDGFPEADEEYWQGLQKTLHPLIAEAVCRGIKREEFVDLCSEIFKEFEKQGGK